VTKELDRPWPRRKKNEKAGDRRYIPAKTCELGGQGGKDGRERKEKKYECPLG